MAKKTLQTFHDDSFLLWGLLSSNGAHRICWELNKCFNFRLVRQEDLILEKSPTEGNIYFNFYLFINEFNFFRVELIKNKSDGEFYLKELKNFDFLLMVKGELDFFEVDTFTNVLKQFTTIHSALAIDLNKIKNITQLVLE